MTQRDLDVQMCEFRLVTQSTLSSNAGCCPRENKIGMRGSPCDPPFPVGWAAFLQVRPPTNTLTVFRRNTGLISVLHPQQSSPHRVPGDQIVRPDPVNGHNGRVAVHIRETLHDVNNALTTCFGGQGVMEGSGGFSGLLRNLLCHGSCDQPAHNVSHEDPCSHHRLVSATQSPHMESFNDLHGHIPWGLTFLGQSPT